MEPGGGARRNESPRVGLFSAAALCAAATAGTLAGGALPTGNDRAADAVQFEAPRWLDGLDHVVVMTDEAADPHSAPRPPVAALTAPAGLDPVVTSTPSTVSPAAPAPVVTGDLAVAEALRAVDGVADVQPVAAGVFAVATAGSRDAVLAVPGVASLVDDVLFTTFDDPDQSRQWGVANTGDPVQANGAPGVRGADANVVPAWGVAEGEGVVVAVLDTGVEWTHPDLAGRMWANPDEVCGNGVDDDANGFVDDCRGWDFGANDADPAPDPGLSSADHGTHVAGIVAAARNGIGIVGIAPRATIMPIKAATPASTGLPLSALYAGLVYAADNGAEVVNMSFGTMPFSAPVPGLLLETGIAHAASKGVTLVAAAGNANVDIGVTPVYPASYSTTYPAVITVGSTTNTDARSGFSCYGRPVNIYAPGSSIWSLSTGGTARFKSGTSMAAPHVAGAAALVLSAGRASSPAEVRQRLVSTSRALAWGPRLDAGAAVDATGARSMRVLYEGMHTLAPEVVSSMGVRVSSSNLPAAVTAMRVSLATVETGLVYAVEGLAAQVRRADGTTQEVISSSDGVVATVPLDDTTRVTPSEWRIGLTASLPAGSYAVVTEMIDDAGTAVGGTYVAYAMVANRPAAAAPPTTLVATTTTALPVVPSTSVPSTSVPSTSLPSTPATSTPAATTPTTTNLVATTTTALGPTPGPTAPASSAPGTTVPTPSTAPAAPTTTPSMVPPTSTGPPTSNPDTSNPDTSNPDTSIPATSTPTAGPTPTTVAPAPSAPTSTDPATTAPTTTAPPPAPDADGAWRLERVSPSSAPLEGGATIEVAGRFPTWVPVYVWFGDRAVVLADNDGTTLRLRSPDVATAETVDLVVRFSTSRGYELVLAQAFTFVAAAGPPPDLPPPVASSIPSSTAPSTSSSMAPGPTAPTVPPTVPVPPTTGLVSPTTAPASTVAPAPTAAPTPPEVVRGAVRLRPPSSGSALARLSGAGWPGTGCTSDSCFTSSL